MSVTAILLLAVSAVLHALWNLICKRSAPSAAFLLVANTLGCLILVPVAIARGVQYAAFPSVVWLLVLFAGVFQAIYYASLAGAYRSGDMSLAYPLARSSPVIVVTAVTFLLGQGDAITRACVLGILLVVAGCYLLPRKTFSDFRPRNYLFRTFGLALVAALGTAGYSIVDAEALRSVKQSLGGVDGIVVATMLYALVEAVASSLFLGVYVAARKTERMRLRQVLTRERRTALLAGISIYLTYTLVLISMSFARNVSYVVGFRQLSIPLGMAMGMVFLKEPVGLPKVVGAVTLVAGLVLIALG